MISNCRKLRVLSLWAASFISLTLAGDVRSNADLTCYVPKIMYALNALLEEIGMDVHVSLPGAPDLSPLQRPRVVWIRPCAGRNVNARSFTESVSAKNIKAGKQGGLAIDLGSKSNETALNEQEFSTLWEKAAGNESRVFLAFAREDVVLAGRVQKALNKLGYTTFLYLKPQRKTPSYTPDYTIQRLFEADHVLGLETENSRKSKGFQLENFASDYVNGQLALGEIMERQGGDFQQRLQAALREEGITPEARKMTPRERAAIEAAEKTAEENDGQLREEGRSGEVDPKVPLK